MKNQKIRVTGTQGNPAITPYKKETTLMEKIFLTQEFANSGC